MSSSSQQPDSSITLNDTYTIDVSNLSYSSSDTITISDIVLAQYPILVIIVVCQR